ncbi:MAG: DUF2959 domain-containing protein [Methylococcales bacterium]
MEMTSSSRKKSTPKKLPQSTTKKRLPIVHSILQRCRRSYFRIREVTGQHKRDIIVHRVEDAATSLDEAKHQFQCALDKFSALVNFHGGDLESKYKQLKQEFDHSQSKAKAIHDHINSVEDVAEALFDEWEKELELYTNRRLRSNSRQALKLTKQHYHRLIKVMKRAENKTHPILAVFQDQVLYLKHNLNAKAIASLHHEMVTVGMDIATLISAMEKSIAEANAFTTVLTEQKVLSTAIA